MTPGLSLQQKRQWDGFCGDQDRWVRKPRLESDGPAVAGLRTGGFAEEGPEETRVVGGRLSGGGEGVLFADEDLRVLRWRTRGFDGTEDKGDYGAEITGEE